MMFLTRRFPATESSAIAIWTACVFVVMSALLNLLPEPNDLTAMRTWTLRGTIVPPAEAEPRATVASEADFGR